MILLSCVPSLDQGRVAALQPGAQRLEAPYPEALLMPYVLLPSRLSLVGNNETIKHCMEKAAGELDGGIQQQEDSEEEEEERLWGSREEFTSSKQLQGAQQLEARNKPQW